MKGFAQKGGGVYESVLYRAFLTLILMNKPYTPKHPALYRKPNRLQTNRRLAPEELIRRLNVFQSLIHAFEGFSQVPGKPLKLGVERLNGVLQGYPASKCRLRVQVVRRLIKGQSLG